MLKRHGSAVAVAACLLVSGSALAEVSSTKPTLVNGANSVGMQSGNVAFEFEAAALEQLGVRFVAREESGLTILADSTLAVETAGGRFDGFNGGTLNTHGALLVVSGNQNIVIGNFAVSDAGEGTWTITSTLEGEQLVFEVSSSASDFSSSRGSLTVYGEIALSSGFAGQMGRPELANVVVGRMMLNANSAEALNNADVQMNGEGSVAGSVGPDVIVGDLPNMQRWGRVNGITAYSVATTSCNIGSERLDWISSTNNHPVIGQNLYRLKDGRFEQIGLSWLKHGFFALSGSLCSPCNDPTDGSQLGVGCSDPYSSGLNGEQGNLGPRYQVNPSTGFYPFPFTAPPAAATIGRRIQVADMYLEPDLNAGALYFVEGHYIAPSDAVIDDDGINNAHNNASYRRVTVAESSPNNYNITTTGQTQREKPGIVAWRDFDLDAKLLNIDVPNDGRLILGYKVTDLGNGMWHYEYAVQNLDSDRSAGIFRIPVPTGVQLTNIGFHDVGDHSGAPYDTTDWTATHSNGYLTWNTTEYAQNPNSNAIRWGSMYNFRFDANAEPIDGEAQVGLFKPGTPSMMTVIASVPDLAMAITQSTPPTQSIDARQPSLLDGSGVTGWQFITLEFTGYALDLTVDQLEVTQQGGTGPAPTILTLLPVDNNVVTAFLDRPISPAAWTTITHMASGSSTRIGFLPGDVNGDGTASPVDILSLIDSLNGVGQPLSIWATDIDRSGSAEPADILREIDLLNGAGEFDVYNGATLPQ